MKYTEPKIKSGDGVKNSKKDIPFQKEYKPQFTDRIFEISANTRKPPTYIIKDGNFGKIYKKNSYIHHRFLY